MTSKWIASEPSTCESRKGKKRRETLLRFNHLQFIIAPTTHRARVVVFFVTTILMVNHHITAATSIKLLKRKYFLFGKFSRNSAFKVIWDQWSVTSFNAHCCENSAYLRGEYLYPKISRSSRNILHMFYDHLSLNISINKISLLFFSFEYV